jgi:hypothetical protein
MMTGVHISERFTNSDYCFITKCFEDTGSLGLIKFKYSDLLEEN